MKKAKHCDECRHFGGPVGPVCLRGHKPRFYLYAPHGGVGGWKRRCDDFEMNWLCDRLAKAIHTLAKVIDTEAQK